MISQQMESYVYMVWSTPENKRSGCKSIEENKPVFTKNSTSNMI